MKKDQTREEDQTRWALHEGSGGHRQASSISFRSADLTPFLAIDELIWPPGPFPFKKEEEEYEAVLDQEVWARLC